MEVDASLGKVTVTGTVDSKTLIKKLQKSGKAVEPWPASQPIKLAPPTPQPKQASKEAAKGKDVKKGQPQPSTQKPEADDASKDNSNANSSTKKVDSAEKKKQTDKDVTPGDQDGNKKANKKNNNGGGDNGSKSGSGNNENSNKAKLVEANGDAAHSNGGTAASSSKNNQANNNGGGTPNANNNKKKKSDIDSEVDGENVVSPQNDVSGTAEKGSKSSSKKKGGEAGVSQSTETDSDDLFVDASPTRSTANKHMAPPPMVLVKTSEYSADIESAEDYATHMFSDENANNCTLM